jgi:hypothetical protein
LSSGFLRSGGSGSRNLRVRGKIYLQHLRTPNISPMNPNWHIMLDPMTNIMVKALIGVMDERPNSCVIGGEIHEFRGLEDLYVVERESVLFQNHLPLGKIDSALGNVFIEARHEK